MEDLWNRESIMVNDMYLSAFSDFGGRGGVWERMSLVPTKFIFRIVDSAILLRLIKVPEIVTFA